MPRGEVLFDGDRLGAVDCDVEGPVVRRQIEFLVGIPPKPPILSPDYSRQEAEDASLFDRGQ